LELKVYFNDLLVNEEAIYSVLASFIGYLIVYIVYCSDSPKPMYRISYGQIGDPLNIDLLKKTRHGIGQIRHLDFETHM